MEEFLDLTKDAYYGADVIRKVIEKLKEATT